MQTFMQLVYGHRVLKLLALILSMHLTGISTVTGATQEEAETLVSGVVIDREGQPAADTVVALCRHSEDISDGKSVTTDANGMFSISIVASPRIIEAMHLECKRKDGSSIGYLSLRSLESKLDLNAIELRMSPVKKAPMVVLDADERPVPGAKAIARLSGNFGRIVSASTNEAGMAELIYTDEEPVGLAFAWKDQVGFDYHLYQPAQKGFGPAFPSEKPERFKLEGANPIKLRFVDDQKRPLKGVKVYPFILNKSTQTNLRSNDLNLSAFLRFVQQPTDANGEVSFDWLPSWQKGRLSFISAGGNDVVRSQIPIDLLTVQGVQEVQLARTVAIRGNVVGIDGKPAKGITVSATSSATGISAQPTTSQTDELGNYVVHVAPNQIYMVIVKDRKWASKPQQGFVVFPNTPVEGKNFKLRKATRIFGKVRGGFWLADVPNHRVVFKQFGNSLSQLGKIQLPEVELPNKLNPNSKPMDTFEVWTDEKGNFELFVGDGDFARISDGGGVEFKVSGTESYEVNFEAKLKAPPPVVADASAPLLGLIVDDGNDKACRDCSVTIVPRGKSPSSQNARPSWEATTDAEGKFRAERIKIGSFVHALSSDKKRAAIIEVKDEKSVFVMKLRPVGMATGRILSADGNTPIANQKLACSYIVPFQDRDDLACGNRPWGTPSFLVDSTTDADGRFRFEPLVPNVDYRVYVGQSINVTNPWISVKVTPGEEVDLGDLKLP